MKAPDPSYFTGGGSADFADRIATILAALPLAAVIVSKDVL